MGQKNEAAIGPGVLNECENLPGEGRERAVSFSSQLEEDQDEDCVWEKDVHLYKFGTGGKKYKKQRK